VGKLVATTDILSSGDTHHAGSHHDVTASRGSVVRSSYIPVRYEKPFPSHLGMDLVVRIRSFIPHTAKIRKRAGEEADL
jgi:hypothetical protein